MRRSLHTLQILVLLAASLHAQDSTYIQWDPPQQISFGPYSSVAPQIIGVGDTVHLAWTTNNGPLVFYARSTNAGTTWSAPVTLDDTTNSVTLNGGSFSAASHYAYVFWSRCEPPCVLPNMHTVLDMRRSVDGGATWLPRVTIAEDGIYNWASFSMARDTTVGFINYVPGRFGWSSDAGLEWRFNGGGTRYFDRFVILDDGIHLVREVVPVGSLRVEVSYLSSTDFGQTWTAPYILSSFDSVLSDEPHIAGDIQGNLYCVWRDFEYGGTDDGTILLRRSTDAGEHWQDEIRLTSMPIGVTPQVACEGPRVVVLWSSGEGRGVRVRLSADYGTTFFADQTISFGGDGVLDIARGWVHASWFDLSMGHPEIFYDRGRIVTTGVAEESQPTKAFGLDQNYPNPFNAQTTFRFSVPRRTHVRLSIYDVLGRELALLVDQVKEPGAHSVLYNWSHLASGLYFYRIQTPEFTAAKKFVVVK
jgi:hypothetical protein